MLEGRGRLALGMVVAVAAAAGVLTVTGAAVAGADCSATRDVLVTSLAAAEGTQRYDTQLTLTVVSRGCALPGSVAYALRPVTTDKGDLTYHTGVLTFAEGDMKEQTLTVDVRADDQIEQDEQFIVALIDLRGSLRACDTMATVTIVNDDPRFVPPASPSPGIYPCELHSSR